MVQNGRRTFTTCDMERHSKSQVINLSESASPHPSHQHGPTHDCIYRAERTGWVCICMTCLLYSAVYNWVASRKNSEDVVHVWNSSLRKSMDLIISCLHPEDRILLARWATFLCGRILFLNPLWLWSEPLTQIATVFGSYSLKRIFITQPLAAIEEK